MNHSPISIIGGGIAGLATAIAAARSGRSATIYEKAKSFEPVGAGLQLGPNAVRALKAIGAWDAVEPITSSPPAICMRDGKSGKLLKHISLGKTFEQRFGQAYRVALRADLHKALLAVASQHSAIEIKLGKDISVEDLDHSNPIVAADGVNSKTRTQYFQSNAAITTTDVAYRALFPKPEINGVDMDCVNLWLCPQSHVVHYPVGQDQKLNIVAITQSALPQTHYANSAGSLRQIINATLDWKEWPLAYVAPLPAWTKGNVTLVGDSAHGTLPYLAQGAAMALEDAAAFAATNFNPEKFFELRAARCTKLHNASLRAGKIYHLVGAAAKARNLALAVMPERSFLAGLNWLYAGG